MSLFQNRVCGRVQAAAGVAAGGRDLGAERGQLHVPGLAGRRRQRQDRAHDAAARRLMRCTHCAIALEYQQHVQFDDPTLLHEGVQLAQLGLSLSALIMSRQWKRWC